MSTTVLLQAVPPFLSLSLACLAVGLTLSTRRSQQRLPFDRHVYHRPLFSSPLATYFIALVACVYALSGILDLVKLGLGAVPVGVGSNVLQAVSRFGASSGLAYLLVLSRGKCDPMLPGLRRARVWRIVISALAMLILASFTLDVIHAVSIAKSSIGLASALVALITLSLTFTAFYALHSLPYQAPSSPKPRHLSGAAHNLVEVAERHDGDASYSFQAREVEVRAGRTAAIQCLAVFSAVVALIQSFVPATDLEGTVYTSLEIVHVGFDVGWIAGVFFIYHTLCMPRLRSTRPVVIPVAIHHRPYAFSTTSLASTSPRPLSIPTNPSPPTRLPRSTITPLSSTVSEEFLPTTTNDPFSSPPLGSLVVRSHSNTRSRSSLRTKNSAEDANVPAVPSIPPEFRRGRTREREQSGSKSLEGEPTIEEEKEDDYLDEGGTRLTEIEEREAPSPALPPPTSTGKPRRKKGVRISITTSGPNVKRKRRSPNLLAPRPSSTSSRPKTPVPTRSSHGSRPGSMHTVTALPKTPSESRPASAQVTAFDSPSGLGDGTRAPRSSPAHDDDLSDPAAESVAVQPGSYPPMFECSPIAEPEADRRIREQDLRANLNNHEPSARSEGRMIPEGANDVEANRPEMSTATWALGRSFHVLGIGQGEIQKSPVETPVDHSRNPSADIRASRAGQFESQQVDMSVDRSRNPSVNSTPIRPQSDQVALLSRVVRNLLDLPSRPFTAPFFGVRVASRNDDERKSGESTQTPTPILRTPKQSPRLFPVDLPEPRRRSEEQVSEFGELAGPSLHGQGMLRGLVPLRNYGPFRIPTDDAARSSNPIKALPDTDSGDQVVRPGTPFEIPSKKSVAAFRRQPPLRRLNPASEQSDKLNDLEPPSSFPRSHFSVSPPNSFVASRPIDVPRPRARTDHHDHFGNEFVPRVDYMRPRSSWPPSSLSSSGRPGRQMAKMGVDSARPTLPTRAAPASKPSKATKSTRFYISSSSEVTSDSGYAASHDSISPPIEPDHRSAPES